MAQTTRRCAPAARWQYGLLAMAAVVAYTHPCMAQLEPLPSVAPATSFAAAPLDQGSPLLPGPPHLASPPEPIPSGPVNEPIWTPYGEGTVTRSEPNGGVEYEPCYDMPPTGFEGSYDEPWEFQLMPKSLIWHSYLAGPWEPRFASVWSHDRTEGWLWDVALGGRVGIFRYGTKDCAQPSGWEVQMEGAAFPQLDPENQVDVNATDYRFGAPLVYGHGRYQMKFGFYHISSHLGDEYIENNPGVQRINFGRNALAWGHSYYVNPDLRLYGEMDWAWDCEYSEPWYFQFGFDYCPILKRGNQCSPFVAMNCQLREELDFGGHFVAQAGWAWRYGADRRMFRVGVQYYDGGNQQFSFYQQSEQKVGLGLWYDY